MPTVTEMSDATFNVQYDFVHRLLRSHIRAKELTNHIKVLYKYVNAKGLIDGLKKEGFSVSDVDTSATTGQFITISWP